MAKKFLDYDGLLYFWQKLKSYFVKQEAGKGLSTNDYSTADKEKLAGIDPNANAYTLPMASTDTLGGVKVGSGLSITEGVLSATGGGVADAVEWTNVQNRPSVYPPETHTHAAAQVTGLHDVATSGDYNDLDNTPTIPKDLGDLTNTAGYQKAADVEGAIAAKGYKTETEIKGIVEDYDYQTSTQVESAITGKGYQTSAQVEAAITGKGYQTASDVASAIAGADHLKRQKVTSLPTVAEADTNTIYMVKIEGASGNEVYTEWMVMDGEWEKMGDSRVDLTGYIREEDLEAVSNTEIDAILAA